MNGIVNKKEIFTMATDPIYIGTGGYTIGRVDNTIVRDPITKIPKIPGSSLAGTWRYYMALELISKMKDYQPDFEEIKKKTGDTLVEKIKKEKWGNSFNQNNWLGYYGNKIAKITCAGQDNVSTAEINSPDAINKEGKTGHCGHCIVCKAFGYSKADKSWQGMLFFSDLNILFFPVYTRIGVKWISSSRILKEAGIKGSLEVSENKIKTKDGNKSHLNLGWINLEVEGIHGLKENDLQNIKFDNVNVTPNDIVIVPDSIISQIINSNLEVRTSVSIDPITGAAKEGALFTSEAIPRGTIFYGEIRLFDKSGFPNQNSLPSEKNICQALEDSKQYYETLGIGGMTTRGFGRMKVELYKDEKLECKDDSKKNSTLDKATA
jgi:CRISPR-associated protein Cmr4